MSDREALLATVIHFPNDMLPRLIYADFLDERGDRPDDGKRAELIRLQIEIGDLTANSTMWTHDQEGHLDALVRRERQLMDEALETGALDNACHWRSGWKISKGLHPYCHRNDDGVRDEDTVSFDRGFIRVACVKAAVWVGGRCSRCNGTGIVARYRRMPLPDGTRRFHLEHDGTMPCGCDGGNVPALGTWLVSRHPISQLRLTDEDSSLETFLADKEAMTEVGMARRRVTDYMGMLVGDDMEGAASVLPRLEKPLLKWARRKAGLA